MAETSELLPCPFCGGEAMLFRPKGLACCADDECPGWQISSTTEAWNRRAALSEAEPAAWQRYSDRLGWTTVDANYAKTLQEAGEKVRALYAAPPRGAVTEDVWKIIDRLLVDAYAAGSSSADFDMLAAKSAVEAAGALASEKARAAQITDSLTRLRHVIALALDIVPESAVTLDAHDVLTLRQRLSTARLILDGAFTGGPAHG